MDIMELGAIGELLGGVAVIASLIFVGPQVRGSNHLARAATELEVGRMNIDSYRLLAEGDADDFRAFVNDLRSNTQKSESLRPEGA